MRHSRLTVWRWRRRAEHVGVILAGTIIAANVWLVITPTGATLHRAADWVLTSALVVGTLAFAVAGGALLFLIRTDTTGQGNDDEA